MSNLTKLSIDSFRSALGLLIKAMTSNLHCGSSLQSFMPRNGKRKHDDDASIDGDASNMGRRKTSEDDFIVSLLEAQVEHLEEENTALKEKNEKLEAAVKSVKHLRAKEVKKPEALTQENSGLRREGGGGPSGTVELRRKYVKESYGSLNSGLLVHTDGELFNFKDMSPNMVKQTTRRDIAYYVDLRSNERCQGLEIDGVSFLRYREKSTGSWTVVEEVGRRVRDGNGEYIERIVYREEEDLQ